MSKRIGVFVTFWLLLLLACPAQSQTPVTLSPVARQQFFAADGTPLAGGCVFTYNSGTSTPAATYTDAGGLFTASNPIILDGGGFASIWIASQAYRFVVVSNGGVNCATGSQQWVVDGIQPPPFLAAANAWTGNETHSGTETFNGPISVMNGGSLAGALSGSPSFTGTLNFSGNPTFTGIPTFSNGAIFSSSLSADNIFGINSSGGTMQVIGNNGTGAIGESVVLSGGTGPAGFGGGGVAVDGGAGGSGSQGGAVTVTAGAAGAGNVNGSNVSITASNASGNGSGGAVMVTAGKTTGSAAGGDVDLSPGDGATGSLQGSLVLKNGRIIYTDYGVHYTPSCVITGGGASVACSLDSLSKDSDGYISFITGGSGIAATGTVVLTFSHSMGGNGATCMWNLSNVGTGQWDPRATVFVQTQGTSTATATWDNNSSTLSSGDSYAIAYHCIGRQ